jgi:hypothetical protein
MTAKPRPRPTPPARAPHPATPPAVPFTVLLGALLSPVVIFYGAGYLLSFGYFFAIGPALMTAFGSNELALIGFARLSGPIAVLSFIAFFAVTAGFYLGSIKTPILVPQRWANAFAGIVCLAAAAFIAWASWRASFLATMLGIVAIFVVGAIGVAIVAGKEDSLRRAGHPWRWLLPSMLLILGLPALGAAGFQEATEPTRAQFVMVERPGGPKAAMLLAAGAAAIIYEVDGRRFLAGPRGETPMEIVASAGIQVRKRDSRAPREEQGPASRGSRPT